MLLNATKTVSGLVTIVILALLSQCNASNTCKGCTDLDELTFEKLLKRFKVTIIKFDIAYPYGDQHEAFSRFAQGIYIVPSPFYLLKKLSDSFAQMFITLTISWSPQSA